MNRRVREVLKTLLILLLLVSAGFLCYLNWFVDQTAAPEGEAEEGRTAVQAAARPVSAAVTWSGGRQGAAWDASSAAALYEPWRELLGQALGAAEKPEAVPAAQWRSALEGEGVYFAFPAPVPLEALSVWNGFQPSPELAGVQADRAALSFQGDAVLLCYWSEKGAYVCSTGLSGDYRARLAAEYSANGAEFSFDGADRETLFLPGPSAYPVVEVQEGDAQEDRLSQALTALRLSPYTNNRYTGEDGAQVFVEGRRTLRVGAAGALYRDAGGSSESDEHLLVSGGEEPGAAEKIEGVRALAQSALSGSGADWDLVLTKYEERSGSTVVGFTVAVNGVPVLPEGMEHSLEATIRGRVIVEVSLDLTAWRVTENLRRILPMAQACAALEEGRLYLAYGREESGDYTANWFGR